MIGENWGNHVTVERTEYGVFWKTRGYECEWKTLGAWFDDIQNAITEMHRVREMEQCAGAKLVRRKTTTMDMVVLDDGKF